MNVSGRILLWGVITLQIMMLVGAFGLVAMPLAKRSASDLAGLMLVSAQTWQELPPHQRTTFATRLQQDTGLMIERGVLPDGETSWKPHWYADWVRTAFWLQARYPEQVSMQNAAIEVLLLIDDEPIVLRAPSPSLGRFLMVFVWIGLLAIAGTLLALWWQKRWQKQMWRHQLILSGLAHDFRTPLTRLKLHLALLTSLTTEQRQAMNHQLTELAEMIDITLALATQQQKPPSAQQPHPQRPLAELWQSWQDAYPEVTFRADEALISISVNAFFGRIVQNLIDNALVHGQGHVQVALTETASQWHLSVLDEGLGISDAVWSAIEQDLPPPAKGVGLGLLGSRWLAKLSGLKLLRIKGELNGVTVQPASTRSHKVVKQSDL